MTTEDKKRLRDLAEQSGLAIAAIKESNRLILTTYGEGCENSGAHPDSAEIERAARTLIVHLSWLKSRADNLTLREQIQKQA